MKKIIAILLCSLFINLSIPVGVFADDNCKDCVSVEHMQLPKKLAKKTPTNIVNSSAVETEILPYNTLHPYIRTYQVSDLSYHQMFSYTKFGIGELVRRSRGWL